LGLVTAKPDDARERRYLTFEKATGYTIRMVSGNDSHDSEIDQAGEALLRMFQQSADALEQDHRRVLEEAHRIGDRVRAARDRIAELESELAEYRDKADRAEEWLNRIQNEIAERFGEGGRRR
jgi:chromosome segregation ATPase